MRFFDAIVSFVGKVIIFLLSLTALITLATFLVVTFKRDSACKAVSVNPMPPIASSTAPHLGELAAMPEYMRGEQRSPLTVPEWYIVYSAREYAHFLSQKKAATDFPFGYSTAQYWCSYSYVNAYAEKNYLPDTGAVVKLMAIGAGFSAENIIQSVYEQSFGRLSAWGGTDTPEDAIQREEAQKYAAFLDESPWYDYPYFSAVGRVWAVPLSGPRVIRKWERKISLSVGYGMKGVYGYMIGKIARAAYSPAETTIQILVRGPLSSEVIANQDIKVVKDFGDGALVLEVPRYQKFTRVLQLFAHEQVEVLDVAGGKTIIVSALAPGLWYYDLPGIMLFAQPLSVDQLHKRVVAAVPVPQLMEAIKGFASQEVTLEHVYDY